MKKIICVFVLGSLLVCNTALPIYANDSDTADENVSINTIKGRTNVYNSFAEESISFDINTSENTYFVDFSMLLADFNSTREMSIAENAILTVNEQGTLSVLGKTTDIKAEENQWMDISICADPNSGNYSIDLDGKSMSGNSELIKALTSMTLDIKNVASAGTRVYVTVPETGELGGSAMSAPANRRYITSFAATQGGAPDYIRDTIADPTGYGKGSVQRLSLNNQKWMEGRAEALLENGVWEVSIDLYFDDFNALTNSIAARMNGSAWMQFCTFNHSKRELVFGNRNGTSVICSGYEMQKWYNLRIIIDFDNSEYTVYLFDNEGKCIGTGTESFDSSYKSLSQLSLYVGDSGVAGAKTSTMYVHDYAYVKPETAGIIKTKPHNGETNCGTDGVIYIQSVNAVDEKSFEEADISADGTLSMSSPDTIKLEIGELEKDTQYDISISGIKDIFGNELNTDILYTTGNGIIYGNLKLSGGTLKLDYSGDISSEDLILYAAAYNVDNNKMTECGQATAAAPEASVKDGESIVVQGYLWDSAMNIMTPSVGEKQNKYSSEQPCDITISKDYDTNIAVIKGTAKNAAALILRDKDDNIIMIDEVKTSANGFFKSEFFNDVIGTVKLYINTQDGTGIRNITSEFYTRNQIDEIVDSFNADNADYDSLIKTNAKLFGFDLTEYDGVSADTVSGLMKGKTYGSFSDVVNNYNYAMAAALFNAAQDGKTAAELEARYESVYGFDKTKTYNYYLETEENVREKLFANIASRSDYTDIEDVVEEFEGQVVLAAIECTEINSEVIPILKANNEYIGLDFTDFDKLTNSSNVTSQIKGKKFASVEELKDTFDELVENELDKKTSGSGHTGGGGGGGGSTGGSGIIVPKNNDVELNNTKEVIENIKVNSVSFADIKEVPWAEECIIYLYNKKIIDGKSDNEFKPNDNITRSEFVKLVSLAFPSKAESKSKVFSDVEKDAWYAPYIENAYDNGWINGISDDIFGVNDNITREDMAVILYRIAKTTGIPIAKEKTVLFYDDDEISSYAKEAVNALAEGEIISGNDNNEFMPKKTATRAEATKLIYCLVKIAENN